MNRSAVRLLVYLTVLLIATCYILMGNGWQDPYFPLATQSLQSVLRQGELVTCMNCVWKTNGSNSTGKEAGVESFSRSFSFKEDAVADYGDRSVIGKCEEMFTISEGNTRHVKAKIIRRIIKKLNRNKENNFGGLSSPFKELSTFLPSLLEKNSLERSTRSKNSSDESLGEDGNSQLNLNIKKILARIDRNETHPGPFSPEEASTVRKYMIASQNFSYELIEENRLQRLDGWLPYVPCKIKTKFSTNDLMICFNKTTVHSSSTGRIGYHIAFFGDSKLRGLFVAFLLHTQALNYTMVHDGEESALEIFISHLMAINKITLIEAYSQRVPGLKLTATWEQFLDYRAADFAENENMQKLARWATGSEPAPDLLIIGYGQWLLLMVTINKLTRQTILEPLDLAWRMGGAVTRLLLDMTVTTRVLVLAQSRNKPTADAHTKTYALPHSTLSDTNVEWVESLFLSRLKEEYRFRAKAGDIGRRRGVKNDENIDDSVEGNTTNDYSKGRDYATTEKNEREMEISASTEPSHSSSFTDKISIGRKSQIQNNLLEKFLGKRNFTSIVRQLKRGSDVWFWDSTLPLKFATSRDCATLYHHDPTTVKLLKATTNTTIQNLYFTNVLNTIIQKRDFDDCQMDSFGSSKSKNENCVRGSESSTFSSNRRNEITISVNRSKYHLDNNYQQDSDDRVEQDSDNVEHDSINIVDQDSDPKTVRTSTKTPNEYFDAFSAAYSQMDLNCFDFVHSSSRTEYVEVMQILNLVCNRHLRVSQEHCCVGV